jgi:hypothetical protein
MIKSLKIIGLLMFLWNLGFAQSQWVNQVSEELGTFEKNYLYPSVLRALNINESDEFNQLIKDIRFVRVLRIDSAFIAENQAILTEAESEFKKESFENIAQMQDSDGSKKTLLVKTKNDRIIDFLAYIENKESLLIVEIVGELNIKNLRNLMNIDYGNFNEFVGLDLGL